MKNHKENAVSEVVGVMLMLSVTIILVSVVAVIVSSSMDTDNRAITADIKATGVNGGNITMELTGGDSFSLKEIKITLGIREVNSETKTLTTSDIKSYSGSNTISLGDRFKLVGERISDKIKFGDFEISKGQHLTYRIFDTSGNAVSSGEILIN